MCQSKSEIFQADLLLLLEFHPLIIYLWYIPVKSPRGVYLFWLMMLRSGHVGLMATMEKIPMFTTYKCSCHLTDSVV